MRPIPIALLCCATALASLPARAADTLKVIVIDGGEAANIVAERLAAVPVVEVRDKDDRRVPGAVVRFLIRKARNRLLATFRNGQAEVRTITDTAGQANSSAIVPLEPGGFEIEVEVSYAGDSGKAVVRQTNFRTVADAKAAGREPGKSTSSNAQATSAGATGTAAAGAAAGTTTGSAATTATSASVGAGGGVSKVAVVGLVAGGAAGAGAAVVLSQKKTDPPPAGIVGAVAASVTTGLQASTAFSFSVQPTGFEAGSTRYQWEFGDGDVSTDAAPRHTYSAPGSYTVAVTVSDSRQSARSELTVRVHSASGTWFNGALGAGTTLELTQSGSTIVGVENSGLRNCPLSGSIRNTSPQIVLTVPRCPQPGFGDLVAHEFRFDLSSDGANLDGQADYEARLYIVRFVRR